VDEEKSIAHRSGLWALEKLRKIGAPEIVIESVEMRLSTSLARSRFSGSLRVQGVDKHIGVHHIAGGHPLEDPHARSS
jgi:hypothetical protein